MATLPGTIKKLSEYMREGAKLVPQCTDRLHDQVNGRDMCCALGQAYLAATNKMPKGICTSDAASALGIEKEKTEHPVKCERTQIRSWVILDTITDLNDFYNWPTEQIAAWLEGIGF